MSATEIIANRGYPVEIHHVVTDDGYILELHRIPSKSGKGKPVLIQHGVIQDAANWILNPTNSSLAFQLSDLGYDVWLGNSRGNRYSRAHVTYDAIKDYDYWNFAWDEMGNYDIPAVIEYILNQTGQPKLIYVGHSLGSAMFFIAMINNPELNDKIHVMIGLAPASSMAFFKNYLRLLSPFVDQIAFAMRLLRVRSFVDQTAFERRIQNIFCNKTYFQAQICRLGLMSLTGPNPDNLDLESLPLIQSHSSGSGTSVNTILQFMQNRNAGLVFNAFDYGEDENVERYGTTTPQSYDLKQVKAPVHIFWGENDYVVAPEDVHWLATNLGNLKSIHRVEDPKFNHIDFLYGKNVNQMVYSRIFPLLPPATAS